MVYVPKTETVMFPRYDVTKHLEGQHDQASHGRKGPIPAGFANWNSKVETLIEAGSTIDARRGNGMQATFIEAAGFNGKPQILSQKDFDALEGETIYRGVQDEAFVTDYKESLVQFAGEGSFGNGTYATNIKETTEYYSNAGSNEAGSADARTMEMKLLPEANVMSFDDAVDMRNWAKDMSNDFVTQYGKAGMNPAQVQEVEWQLHNDSDWTNIAIMNGVDAVRFQVPMTEKNEYYTIILNRGKVAINGKS